MTEVRPGALPCKELASGIIDDLSERGLRALWASASFERAPFLRRNPYRNFSPLTEVLTHLLCARDQEKIPPFVPRLSCLPLGRLCQLALLWAIAGETERASSLVVSLPLDFPWMWSREEEYNKEETEASIALVNKALGYDIGTLSSFRDPFLQALAERAVSLNRDADPSGIFWESLEAGPFKAAWSLERAGTSLGVILTPFAEIRSFGPQMPPLSQSKGFGILPSQCNASQYASCFAMPEVWFEAKIDVKSERILLDVFFTGIRVEKPLKFSFYVKANYAAIGDVELCPRSLQRYQGGMQPVFLSRNKKENRLKIEMLHQGKMEIVPLAGDGCFWDCEYLISFDICSLNQKCHFCISVD